MKLVIWIQYLEKIQSVIKNATWEAEDVKEFDIYDDEIGQKVIKNDFDELRDTAHIYKNLFKQMKEWPEIRYGNFISYQLWL